MHVFVRHALTVLLHLGFFGPIILGVLDSSFLFFPFGNDLLVVVLVMRRHDYLPLYALAASIGSTIGVLLLDIASRKGGEEGLKRMMKPKRLDYIKRRISDNAAIAIIVACLAPPPFPFTPVIAAASAFQYPRIRLLTIVFLSRVVRFAVAGAAAIWLGGHILRIANSRKFTWSMIVFIVLCLIGSTISIVGWVRRSRSYARQP